jgi:hypothetical protein
LKVEQLTLTQSSWLESLSKVSLEPDLILLFMAANFQDKTALVEHLHNTYSKASIAGCSTAGEISDVAVFDDSISMTLIQFQTVSVKLQAVQIHKMDSSHQAGLELGNALQQEDLQHVMVFSDGLNVNGADLVEGLRGVLNDISITGGLAGDGANFRETFVIHNNNISDNCIVGLGFYGEDLKVGFSSKGGWDSFGIERLVTRSHKNVLYELDGHPALKLYKSFLGQNAKNLPGSGLLFPLSMRLNDHERPLVRTILAVDEATQSLTFAGNIPEGSYVRLMKANVDRLINGAEDSASSALESAEQKVELAILISCVGRKLVLKQLVEEEVEVVRDIMGSGPKITGFYSYGEIAPFRKYSPCELHNQTMTITTLSE